MDQNKILKEEKEILREEKEILKEVRSKEKTIKRLSRNTWILTIVLSLIFLGGALTFAYLKITSGRIYTDKADIEAAKIDLSPQNAGTLNDILVNEGDRINADTVVARVGNELIKSKVAGVVSTANRDIGKLINRGESVVSMYDPSDLRVMAQVEEDKGLADIRIGQQAIFTVDAYSGKQYQGIVDEISPVSRQGDIVFNISDKRQLQEFDIKVRFNIDAYPELKNGMSAKLWIYK